MKYHIIHSSVLFGGGLIVWGCLKKDREQFNHPVYTMLNNETGIIFA